MEGQVVQLITVEKTSFDGMATLLSLLQKQLPK
jgi:hypothetical protein